jgi:serine/threonine-protein kinase
MEDLSGQQFSHYQIVQPLGVGGMAAVYKAYQPNMDRYVALKVLPRQYAATPTFVARFEQEVRVLARLQHPRILPVFDHGESGGYTYLVMPFVEAGTVAGLLRGRPLPMPQVVNISAQVGDALDYAHARGLLHRDIKPSNILIDERGNCLLADFGIAKILEATSQLTNTGGVLGTPAYMSPEQGRGEPLTRHSDIYSLGVVLYELVTGRVPYEAETPVAVIFKHVNDPLPSPRTYNPDLNPRIELVIRKALAKAPADRYDTAGELVQALNNAVAGTAFAETHAAGIASTVLEPSASLPASGGTPARASPPRPRRLVPILLIAAAGLVLLAALAVGALWLQRDQAARALAAARVDTAVAVAAQATALARVPSSTATVAPTTASPPAPTATTPPTEPPTPTVAPTLTLVPVTNTPACPAVSGTFATAWGQVQDRIGCLTSQGIAGLVVEENFQSGKMFWREPIDVAQALVLFSNGTWAIFQHAPYVEGSPEYPCADANTPAQSPPTPRRGFGAMWCDIPALRSGLGNATDAERGYTGQMQSFEHGFMVRTGYGTTFVFYNTGTWERR